jgi:flavin-dependent dehydrogenase
VLFEREVTGFDPGLVPRLSWREPGGELVTREFRFVVDASGYGRVLARHLGLAIPSSLPPMRALFSHALTDRRPPGRRGGFSWAVVDGALWTWVIPFADGTTSVGVVGEPSAFAGLPEDPADCLAHVIAREPNLARRMQGTAFAFEPRSVEAYAANVSRFWGEGFCLIGNAGEFLDPIFSSGIAFAFASARLASAAIDRQLAGETVDWERDFSAPLSEGIDVFRDYVRWWYDGRLRRLFFGQAPAAIQQQICSVLAGHVWDQGNVFVSARKRKIPQLLRVLASGAGLD